jgi:hypothetical protein
LHREIVMRDYDIRYHLHNEYLAHFKRDGESIVVDELGVCNGISVVDVAVINGSLHGFEIKSDSDTLLRLPKQVESYSKVFDYATIVVNGKYVNRVAQLIPDWWGIWLIYEKDNTVQQTVIREARRNQQIDPFAVAQLLWKEEALDLLDKIGLSKGNKTKRRWLLWEILATEIPLSDLCENVRYYLKKRADWKPCRFTIQEVEAF